MQTSQLLLVVVGDVDPAEFRKKSLPDSVNCRAVIIQKTDIPRSIFPKRRSILPNALCRPITSKGFHRAGSDNPDYYAMRVAIAILQSRVFQEVRDKRQLSYAPNAELDTVGANTANIYVTAVDANQAVKVMLDEIEKMRTNLINEKAVSGIAGHFLTIYYIDQETNAAQVRELAKYELIGGGWRNAFNFIDKGSAVTPEQIRDVSKKYMKNIHFIVIGDPASINKYVFLRKFGE